MSDGDVWCAGPSGVGCIAFSSELSTPGPGSTQPTVVRGAARPPRVTRRRGRVGRDASR
ncbi:hypothetical protein CZ771_07745 [Actinomycetales bacterium JB111]|nr:hypothetical protein CZ771_07745 [Actinomycetales bacterium JB111]